MGKQHLAWLFNILYFSYIHDRYKYTNKEINIMVYKCHCWNVHGSMLWMSRMKSMAPSTWHMGVCYDCHKWWPWTIWNSLPWNEQLTITCKNLLCCRIYFMNGMLLPHEANWVIACNRNTRILFFRVGCTPQRVIHCTIYCL